jgi:hypothetical protein
MLRLWDFLVVAPFSGNPYLELELGDGLIHRWFDELTGDEELLWHRDKKYRTIKVLKSDGWHFQFDNEMPFELKPGMEFDIPAMAYHRILKGFGPLELMIQE